MAILTWPLASPLRLAGWAGWPGLLRGSGCLRLPRLAWPRQLPGLARPLRLPRSRSSPRLVLAAVSRRASPLSAAAAPARTAHLSIGGCRTLCPGADGDEPVETAGPPSPVWLDLPALMLADPFVPIDQPLFQRTLDLGLGGAGLLRPDPRPVRTDGLGARVGVGRFRFDHPFRLEIGHHHRV